MTRNKHAWERFTSHGRSRFGLVVLGTFAVVAAIMALLVSASWWALAGAFVLLLVPAVAVVFDLVTLSDERGTADLELFGRKRPNETGTGPASEPSYMHHSHTAQDLEALMRLYTLQRDVLVAEEPLADDPRLLGLDAQIDVCWRALVAVRVASIAIQRFQATGPLAG
jgi:hypothetical protein